MRKALKFMVERYIEALESDGIKLIVEQVMAIEVSVAELSSLANEATRPTERAQIIRQREELRERWLNMLANHGLVQVEKVSPDGLKWFERLTVEEQRHAIEEAQRRLAQARRNKALQKDQAAKKGPAPSAPRLPVDITGPETDREDGTGDEVH